MDVYYPFSTRWEEVETNGHNGLLKLIYIIRYNIKIKLLFGIGCSYDDEKSLLDCKRELGLKKCRQMV